MRTSVLIKAFSKQNQKKMWPLVPWSTVPVLGYNQKDTCWIRNLAPEGMEYSTSVYNINFLGQQDDARMNLSVIMSALRDGAKCLNHVEVVHLLFTEGTWYVSMLLWAK